MYLSVDAAPAALVHDAFLPSGRLSRLMRKRLLQNGIPDDEVDDLVQEIYLGAVRAIPSFDEDLGSLEVWIMGFVRLATKNYYRRAVRRTTSEVHLESMEFVASTTEPMEVESAIHVAIAQLSEIDREIVHLRFVEGLNSQQISDELGMTAVAVRKRLSRSMERIRHNPEIRTSLGF